MVADLSEINPHLALWASENYVSPGERAWEAWVRKLERLIGCDLDGNQDSDGYSLDFAYAEFEAGIKAAVYAADVLINIAAQDAAFGPRVH